MRRAATLFASAVLSVGVATWAGCNTDKSLSTEDREVASLREVTAAFQDFNAAKTAGWSSEITPCMTDPAGGMGFHYGNTNLIDSTLRVEDPELLLYEPDATGAKHLVAVEYIVPYTAHARSAAPPVLFGQPLKQVDAFQLWGLHVWVWKDNPSGLFADWNPTVSCGSAANVTTMTMRPPLK